MTACLLAASTVHSPAIEVTLGKLSQVYDGAPKIPDVTSDPPGQPVDLTYRKTTSPVPPTSGLVFNNIPATLALSYSSMSFSANSMSGMGNYLKLAGSRRKLEACDLTLVTWAKATSYPAWAAANPQGYHHRVRLSIYQLTDLKQLIFLTEVEQSFLIPWRPETLPNGQPYPTNGYAFNVTFAFPAGIVLPEKVMALVSYNTGNAGLEPIKVAGPYDELNLAFSNSSVPITVGADADPGAFLKVRSIPALPEGIWEYPNTSLNTSIPLIRLRALSTHTKEAPVDAGNYEVSGSISDSNFPGGVLGVLTVQKAPAAVQITNLDQFFNGGERPVTVTTHPAGLPVTSGYGDSSAPPTAVGAYDVSVRVDHPNYQGGAGARLTVHPSFASWIEDKVSSGIIPAGQRGDGDDPDRDGVSNLMEYALNLDPALASGDASGLRPLLPEIQWKNSRWVMKYRRNLDAADVSFGVQHHQDLSTVGSWAPITGPEVTLSENGRTRVVEVVLPVPPGGDRNFYRLGVTR